MLTCYLLSITDALVSMFFLNIDKYAKWWQIFFELTLHYIEDQLISIPTSSYVSLASNF